VLAAIQVGVTTTAILAGIFSGVTLAERLEALLRVVPVLATYSKPLSIAVVTIGVTYAALVIGELAPKHIALANPPNPSRSASPNRSRSWHGRPRRRSGCSTPRPASSSASFVCSRASNAP
jgi:putative hemolysin